MEQELLLFQDGELLREGTPNLSHDSTRLLPSVSKTQKRKQSYQNINLTAELNLVGKFELPEVMPYTGKIPAVLTPYSMKDVGCRHGAIHFYVDDYRFTGMIMWGNLAHFTEQVRHYQMVIAPDFSLYLDQRINYSKSCTSRKI